MKLGNSLLAGILTVSAVAFLAACGPPPGEPPPLEIETVDVGGPVDRGLSTEEDEKGSVPAGDDWILSGGVPSDLPLHRPARLVDAGDLEDGSSFVLFHTTTGLAAVRSGLASRLSAVGWSATEAGDSLVATRDGWRVVYTFAPLAPGTEIRVEYRAR